MNSATFDDLLNQQIQQAEARERDARAAEQRLQRMGLPPGSIKPRGYGDLPKVEGLTARAIVAQHDPALAMLLGLPVPRPSYEQQEADAIRQLQADRMRLETEQLRARNQQAQQHRERAAIAGVNLHTGRRLGQ